MMLVAAVTLAKRLYRNKLAGAAVLFIVFALLAGYANHVQAHGLGVAQLTKAPAGPYAVSVWTDPDPARVGTLHVTVAVTEPVSQAPLLDAEVNVELVSLDDDSLILTAAATHENAVNQLLYEAAFEPPSAGQWQGIVSVTGPQGPGEAVRFNLLILPPAPINFWQIGALVLAVLVFALLARSWRKQPPPARRRPLERQL